MNGQRYGARKLKTVFKYELRKYCANCYVLLKKKQKKKRVFKSELKHETKRNYLGNVIVIANVIAMLTLACWQLLASNSQSDLFINSSLVISVQQKNVRCVTSLWFLSSVRHVSSLHFKDVRAADD